MRIGILGSGLMGSKLGTIFARAGHEVVFSYARSEQKLNTLARDAKVRALLETRIAKALCQEAAWEQVKKIVILAQPFSVAQDEMTVSLKIRRNVIVERHRAELEALYRE